MQNVNDELLKNFEQSLVLILNILKKNKVELTGDVEKMLSDLSIAMIKYRLLIEQK